MTPPSKTKAYSRRYDKLRRCGYHMQVDGTITRRKLAALQAIGWSLTDIAVRLGRTQQSLSETFHREAPIHRSTERDIAAVYDELHLTPSPAPYASRTIARARRLRYPAPAAWDCIDNIEDEPQGVLRK